MSTNNSKIKNIIRKYLLDEGLLRKKIKEPKFEFGFQFVFPPGKDFSGQPIGKIMNVIKPKNQDLIIINIGTQIPEENIKVLRSLQPDNKRIQFFLDLKKSFLIKDVFYRINNYSYEISDQIFLNDNGTISKNSLFKSIRKVFNSFVYSTIIIDEYCSGKLDYDNSHVSQEYNTDPDYSLYL